MELQSDKGGGRALYNYEVNVNLQKGYYNISNMQEDVCTLFGTQIEQFLHTLTVLSLSKSRPEFTALHSLAA